MEISLQAFLFQAGYNATLVTIGASLLGFAAGMSGSFLFLRKRALVSDAVAHATLPGLVLGFLCMVMLGGDGRNLFGLLIGSAVTATLGLFSVGWMTNRTRLSEDAAIGAVLSVFFGFGVVLLTAIQGLNLGRQAGLDSFLLGATAGMLFQDAVVIAVGGFVAVGVTLALRRPLLLITFDPTFAQTAGYRVDRLDLIMMALVMAVTVMGLTVVGLILIIALLIIPPSAARFWTDESPHLLWIAGVIGGFSGYLGSALSATLPDLPTGPIIALSAFAVFAGSMLFAPRRGMVASLIRRRSMQLRVHRRQGLLALGRGEPIFDRLTLGVLQREGLMRADQVATEEGAAEAAHALRDERRWTVARRLYREDIIAGRHDGLTPIEDVLTADEIDEVDSYITGPQLVRKSKLLGGL